MAVLSQPRGERVPAGVWRDGHFERSLAVRVVGNRVYVGAGSDEPFGCPTLAAVARLPKGLAQVFSSGCRTRLEELVGAW